jgi:hypothetical protein
VTRTVRLPDGADVTWHHGGRVHHGRLVRHETHGAFSFVWVAWAGGGEGRFLVDALPPGMAVVAPAERTQPMTAVSR